MYGRPYKTTAHDRANKKKPTGTGRAKTPQPVFSSGSEAQDCAKKRTKAKAPRLVFSSDSEDNDFLPTHLQNQNHHSSVVMQNTPVRKQIPNPQQIPTPRSHDLHKSTEMGMDFERCVSCKKPFGYEEIMVCSYCSDNFCCSCANVPPFVATVQFQTPNLRWYCLPCDKHQSTIVKNFKQGIFAYQTAEPTTSTPQPKVARSPKQPQFESSQSEEIVRILSDFANRMDNHELIIGELKNMLCEKQEGRSVVNSAAQRTKPTGSAPVNNPQNQPPHVTQANKAVSFAQAAQTSRNRPKHVRPKDPQQAPANITEAQRSSNLVPSVATAANAEQQTTVPVHQRRRLVLTPVAVNTEIVEKEKRKNNIVIPNLPEQDADDNQAADLEEVNFMITDAMLITDIKAVTARRLGPPRTNGKPRSLLVNLSAERDQVLKKAGSIRQYELWERVYLDPDRTLKERQEYANLRKEFQSRKRNGETDLIIRDGKIVHRRAVPMEIQIEDLTVAPASTLSNEQSPEQNTETQEGQEEPSTQNEAEATQPQPNEGDPQESQAVSDNTLGDLEVPEIMRHEAEEDESAHDRSCSIN